jgi:hypothetical protein
LPEEDDGSAPILLLHPLLAAAAGSLQDFSLPLDSGITSAFHPFNQIAPISPATRPPLRTVTIEFASGPRWKFSIFVDETDFVSISAVIENVHRFLHVRVDGIALPPLQRSEATARFEHRCSLIAVPQTRRGELREGLKRVDLLGGFHRFGGMVWLGRDLLWLYLKS